MEYLSWIMLFVGALARVFLPFLLARRDDPNLSWEWHYLWPQLLSFGIFVLLLPLLVDNLASIKELDPQTSWLVGYGAASFGRLADKGFTSLRNGG